jgi:hypothetical protein
MVSAPVFFQPAGRRTSRLFLAKPLSGKAQQDAGEDFQKAAGGDAINQASPDLRADNSIRSHSFLLD